MAGPMLEAKTLKGFRDFLPDSMVPRQAMIRKIEAVFERHGFQPLMTPALEYLETLMGKYGEEGDKLLYRFEDHGGRQVALRYDLTVPLARVVAQHRAELQLPFRRYHIAPVWRADKPQRGRFREFMQCDADIAGANTAIADAEVLMTGLGVLEALGVDGAVLHLNHRDVLFAVVQAAGVVEPQRQIACIRAIDKLDKLPPERIADEMATEAGLAREAALELIDFFVTARGIHAAEGTENESDYLKRIVETRLQGEALERALAAIARTETVRQLVEAQFPGKIHFDVSIARGLDYYTGVIYETRLTDARVAGIGAVMSGGRYDGLIGMFGKEQIPAVGISLGLDRLLAALQELGLVARSHAVPVYVTVFGPQDAAAALEVAQLLRRAGLQVEVDAVGGKLGKQLERASKRGARLAILVGADEQAARQAVIKDLADGQQHRVGLDALAATARQLLDTAD